MKKLLLMAGLLLGTMLTAQAGTVTITVTTAVAPCNAGACTKTWTDTDANLAKIVTVYGAMCQANNLVGGVPTACSAVQTIAFFFNRMLATSVNELNVLQTQQAIQAMTPPVQVNPQ